MRLRRRVAEPEDFAMTPMIDMVFLLLVFFMCVSSLAQAEKRVPVAVPESHQARVPEDLTDRGVVAVLADGQVLLGQRPVALDELRGVLRAEVARRPELRVVVRAERSVPYGEIQRVLRACAEAGVVTVVYATVQAD
jgi:biopolymer transport protein ExbD